MSEFRRRKNAVAMGNGASKKYDAVVLSDATVHSTDGIPDALVPSTCAETFEAKKQAVTLQNWVFASYFRVHNGRKLRADSAYES